MSTKLDHYPGATYLPAINPGTMGSLSNGDDDKYIVTTKIMVLALAVLFAVVFFVICLHIYAKWIWSTNPQRGPASFWPRWRRNRASARDEIVLDADTLDINTVVGLGKAAVEALPTFRYTMAINHMGSTEIGALECAICLGQFQEDEIGRTLPTCGHSFHLECIDMWLYSHSTCPLCRAILAPDEDDSISLNLETSTIQVFRMERMSTSRRLRGMEPDHNIPPQLVQDDEPGGESEQPSQPAQEQDTGNKRADAIPANVLFWGNLMQQVSADSRTINNSPQAPSHIAIDIPSTTQDRQHGAVHNIPDVSTISNSTETARSRTAASSGRGRHPPSPSPEHVNDNSARPTASVHSQHLHGSCLCGTLI